VLGLDITHQFSAGMKNSFFYNLDSISILEPKVFIRYYLPWLHWPGEFDGPFAQAELGAALFFEHDKVFPSFSGGLSAGWRFNFTKTWYVEPALRLGFPYIWGINATVGIRLQAKKQEIPIPVTVVETVTVTETKIETVVETVYETVIETVIEKVPVKVLVIPDGDKLRVYTPPFIFNAYHADFEGLSEEIIDDNTHTLRHIVDLLNTFPDYRLEVEGYANPTTPEGPRRIREEPVLLRLSEDRAKTVVDTLVYLGVDPDRLSYRGMGSLKTVAPFNDQKTNWMNRRVEFILVHSDHGLYVSEEEEE
jgi:hypothetical protein